MEAFAFYSLATSAWLSIQALPQLFAPSIVLQLLITNEAKPDNLQIYLSRCEAFAQLTLAALSLLLSGLLSSSSAHDQVASTYATPAAVITTIYHFTMAFQAYSAYALYQQTSYALGVAGSGALAALGTWAILFGGDSHYSKRTGKDKRTSGFPFGDKKGRADDLKKET